jgi:hypothetical protein
LATSDWTWTFSLWQGNRMVPVGVPPPPLLARAAALQVPQKVR